MSDVILETTEGAAIPVFAYAEDEVAAALEAAAPFLKAYAASGEFKGKAGQVLSAPGETGALASVWFGLGQAPDAMGFRALAAKLPAGV
jgi:hypothetical protein